LLIEPADVHGGICTPLIGSEFPVEQKNTIGNFYKLAKYGKKQVSTNWFSFQCTRAFPWLLGRQSQQTGAEWSQCSRSKCVSMYNKMAGQCASCCCSSTAVVAHSDSSTTMILDTIKQHHMYDIACEWRAAVPIDAISEGNHRCLPRWC
jgi:hypothetical protein